LYDIGADQALGEGAERGGIAYWTVRAALRKVTLRMVLETLGRAGLQVPDVPLSLPKRGHQTKGKHPMPVISLRYTHADLAPVRAFAEGRGIPLSTAIKQLTEEALQARQKPVESFAESDRRLLRQAVQLQRMSFLFLHAHYSFTNLHHGRLNHGELAAAVERTNAYLDGNPDLYGTVRFPAPAKQTATAKA
jgi:hypothetical protein